MLSVGWLAGAVVLAILLTMWVTFTITRLDRLHARVDAAGAALDAQLVRRAAAVLHLVETPGQVSGAAVDRARYEALARQAIESDALRAGTGEAVDDRAAVENAVGRGVHELAALPLRPDAAAELREAAVRVLVSRRFYNDAVRDTRALRDQRMPRALHLAGRRGRPEFFDIDDTLPAAPDPPARGATLDGPGEDPSGTTTEEIA